MPNKPANVDIRQQFSIDFNDILLTGYLQPQLSILEHSS